MADRLYVFTSRQIIEAVLRSVPAPPWEDIDSAEFKQAENGGVVSVYLKRLPELADLMAPREPSPDLVRIFEQKGAGAPLTRLDPEIWQPSVSPTTFPVMDVQKDEPEECPDPVHELLKPIGHAPPDNATHSIEAYARQTAESPEALYQTLRLYVDPAEHAPTLAQIRKWSTDEVDEAAEWVTIEHAHNSPIAGHEIPQRQAVPLHVKRAMAEWEEEMARLGKPKAAKKKRAAKP